MNHKWTIFCVIIVSMMIGTILTIHLRRHQDGRFIFTREFSDDKIEALRKNNVHLKNLLNSENKINFINVTIRPDVEITGSTGEQTTSGFLKELRIHKNILWAYHLSGRYRPTRKEFIIPLENGTYIKFNQTSENTYQITSVVRY